jgi:hypothetical protein
MMSNRIWKFGRSMIASASLGLMIALGGSFVSIEASAAPLASAAAQTVAPDSDVTLVRDGCGRGMRFSNRLQACVQDRGPPPRVVVVPAGCPRGYRFSNSRQACVPMGGGVDPAAAIIGGVAAGILGAATAPRGRGCGPGLRWSDRRGACVPR